MGGRHAVQRPLVFAERTEHEPLELGSVGGQLQQVEG
jgi:hypothetical protein